MTTKACGKIILLGEHAVVYHTDALAMSLDRGVTVDATAHSEPRLEIPSWQTSVGPDTQSALGRAFGAVLKACSGSSAQRLEAQLEVPAGAGLGCSAALGTAIAKALLGSQADSQDIFRATQAWEGVFHGTPSGIDAWAAQGLGVFLFARGGTPRPLSPSKPLHFAIAHSGRAGSTKEMVQRVAEQYACKASARAQVSRIAELVGRGESALKRGALTELGTVLSENHLALKALDVSTPELDRLCSAFRANGALGAKLTGSGGGGCALALFSSSEAAAAAVEALKDNHTPCFALSFPPGRTVTDDE